MAVSGTAVATVAIGCVSVYAGIKGISIPQAVQAVVQGRSPATLAQANPITLPAASSPTPPGGKAPGDLSRNPSSGSGGGGGTGGVPRATPPSVSNPLPQLPKVAPPVAAPTAPTRLIAPPKKSGSVWWKPWTW